MVVAFAMRWATYRSMAGLRLLLALNAQRVQCARRGIALKGNTCNKSSVGKHNA